MGRDHSIECPRCGLSYGGLNGPDECDCTRGAAMTDRELLEAIAEAVSGLIDEHSKDRYKCSGADSVYSKCRLCVIAQRLDEWRFREP